MASQKVDKVFVLSDSSVNVYGMRLLTSGYKMDEFLKNPIGYYGHKKEDGVLIKWEDVALDGDRVLGKPTINLEHPRAARTIQEIEEGFLNCASVGKLCILDFELEDNPADPNDPIVVVKSWYNKETSLVDNPGNRNAMKVELVDGDDKEINLGDLVEVERSKFLNRMKTIALPVNTELLSLLNLSGDEPTAEAVMEGIRGLHAENKRMGEEATAEKTRVANEKVEAILKGGLDDGRMNVALQGQLRTQFAGKPDELKALVDAMPKHVSLVDAITKKSGTEINLADKSWDELDKSDKLGEVKSKFPELYKAKFREKFGKEPQMA